MLTVAGVMKISGSATEVAFHSGDTNDFNTDAILKKFKLK